MSGLPRSKRSSNWKYPTTEGTHEYFDDARDLAVRCCVGVARGSRGHRGHWVDAVAELVKRARPLNSLASEFRRWRAGVVALREGAGAGFADSFSRGLFDYRIRY